MAAVNEYDPAADYNMVIRQGDTFTRTVTLTTGGTAVNLTTGTAVLTVAEQIGGTSVLSVSATGGTAGVLTLTAAGTATAALDAGVYSYDLTLTLNNVVTTLIAGKFEVLAQV